MNITSDHNHQSYDPIIWSLIDSIIQNQHLVDIPAIVFEYLSNDNNEFDYDDLLNFYEKFGDIEHFELKGKKSIILYKTFFAANQCRVFLQNENNYSANMKHEFVVRWFQFNEDSMFLSGNKVRRLFREKMNYYKEQNANNRDYNKQLQMQIQMINNSCNSCNGYNNSNIIGNCNQNHQHHYMNKRKKTSDNHIDYQHNTNNNEINPNAFSSSSSSTNTNSCFQYQPDYYLNNDNNHLLQSNSVNDNMYFSQNNNSNNSCNLINDFDSLSLRSPKHKQHSYNNPHCIKPNKNINSPLNNNDFFELKSYSSSSSSSKFNNNNYDGKYPIVLTHSTSKGNIIEDNNNSNSNTSTSNRNSYTNSHTNINSSSNNNNHHQNVNNSNGKYTCKYEILIPNDREFQIAKKLIGPNGKNMKKIIDECKMEFNEDCVKLRLRGRGSGFREGPMKMESDEPLHLCVSSKKYAYTIKACNLVNELLERTYDDYVRYCEKANVIPIKQIAIRIYCGNSIHNNNHSNTNYNSNSISSASNYYK